MKYLIVIFSLLTGVYVTACAQHKPETSSSVFKPTATIQEIMLSIIDPNVDYVWNSVATISTREGVEERQPQTDDEWQLVRQHALTLVEASNLLLIEGRKVAVEGASTSIDPVELSPQDIQRLIDANRSDYVMRAYSLHDAAKLFIEAIDKKDVDELVRAGGVVEQACEACHSQFWYPNDKRPQ